MEVAQASVLSSGCSLQMCFAPRVHLHMPLHLNPGHTRHIADIIAWCRSQLLVLKTCEISAFHGLLGTLDVIKNTQLTAGSVGSCGRTCSAQ